jgi:hypothetical protein
MSTPTPSLSPGASDLNPQPFAPAWRAFVHLYFPVFTNIFLTLFIANPFSHRALLLASALPTHYLASLVHQPRPRPIERFTRRSGLHRAAVLYALDIVASYSIGGVLDRPEGAPPRRSEFFVHALATAASTLVFNFIPPSWGLAWTAMGAIDRSMYRAAYLALVDDVVRILAYPEMGSKKEVAVVVGVQAVLIAVSVMAVHFFFVFPSQKPVENQPNTQGNSAQG